MVSQFKTNIYDLNLEDFNLFTLLETYIEELSSWKRQNLSDESISRLKKAGVIKSKDEFHEGIKKGTSEILRKKGFETKEVPGLMTGPLTVAMGNKATVYTPTKDAKLFRLMLRLKYGLKITPEEYKYIKNHFDRHEAMEATAMVKQARKYGNIGAVQFSHQGKVVGQHVSPSVLIAEKKLAEYTNRIYNDARKLEEMRGKTGEYALIKDLTKKYVNRIDKTAAKMRQQNLDAMNKNILEFKQTKNLSFLKKLKARLILIYRSAKAGAKLYTPIKYDSLIKAIR